MDMRDHALRSVRKRAKEQPISNFPLYGAKSSGAAKRRREKSGSYSLPRPKTVGFTLVELLVVITIIGILISLLLPAVQAAREAARRAQCSNNLKQIGLALHMHHEQQGVLPPGHVYGGGSSTFKPHDSTWITRLLPYIEQMAIYDLIEWNRGFGQLTSSPQPNIQVTSVVLSVFVCPSDTRVKPLQRMDKDGYARGNYAVNNGLGPMAESDLSDSPVTRVAGVFYMNSETRIADIVDGTTNTLFVAEVRRSPGEDYRGMMHYPEGPLYHHNRTPNSAVPDEMRSAHCQNTPGTPCIETYSSWNPRSMIYTSRSLHPGGVNVLLGDGSVRPVAESISLGIWHALCTPRAIAGEEIISTF